jgi:hypothetical protein
VSAPRICLRESGSSNCRGCRRSAYRAARVSQQPVRERVPSRGPSKRLRGSGQHRERGWRRRFLCETCKSARTRRFLRTRLAYSRQQSAVRGSDDRTQLARASWPGDGVLLSTNREPTIRDMAGVEAPSLQSVPTIWRTTGTALVTSDPRVRATGFACHSVSDLR